MKRHADLLQLSREHHTALKLARLARFASDAGNPEADGPILAHFGQMLYDHVRFEERELFERAQELLYSER